VPLGQGTHKLNANEAGEFDVNVSSRCRTIYAGNSDDDILKEELPRMFLRYLGVQSAKLRTTTAGLEASPSAQ